MLFLLHDFKLQPWTEVDAVWCLAVRLSCCIRSSPIKFCLCYSIRQTFHFNVDSQLKDCKREWKGAKRGKSSTAFHLLFRALHQHQSLVSTFFSLCNSSRSPENKYNRIFFKEQNTTSCIFNYLLFLAFGFFLSSWQTISVHGWSFKASTLFEFQGKWKNNVKAWRTVASGICFSFTFCKSNGAYHPELWETR